MKLMTQGNHARSAFQPGFARLAALVLTALTLCAALLIPPAQAAEWMQPYLEQVQEWGVMRGDANGDLHEDRSITRAEFVTMVNRAFGYTDVGPNPFSDVDDNDWYAEDIRIAHQAGYFQGDSNGLAAPLSLVTREQAAVFLGRCLRFQGVTGAANSTFADMQDIGGWSRGMVQEAAELGIIQGYPDGTFKPGLPITRGQMACFLVRALGTLVQEPGEQTSGGVYGNLTITTPGVKLKDTTVTGNLYLTGGVGLGDVELENVNVLGKIILTGGGEAEGGKHSVILRNVTAESLEVDSLTDQFLSVMAEGVTNIATTTVRTSAYVEDRTDDGLGLQVLHLDGAENARFQLAGNIKQVVNMTPSSTLQIGQGVADIVTIDEKATDSILTIDNIAHIRELNLDTATQVNGDGGISHLNVNAPDSTVSMLPDTIYVRPGITSNINRVNMDNKTANESSEDPRLLAGYPAARNIAPTSADAVFRTNKAGTIRWALTALMDGSVGEEQLLNPSQYPKIIRSGTLNATAANTDVTARLTGLTREGSYYISAMLEDARGRKSPVKVAAFTTPDDTAPNFANGYPQAPILTTDADGEQVAQIMVMPTKDCQLYYVLLPRGSTAPTAADFRAGALPGSLGSGVVSVRKNTPFLISRINTSHLQEQTQYDLYLWLNDADNGKSSAVRRVQITTKDITPPTITSLTTGVLAPRAVPMRFSLDEPGSLYWVVVKKGAAFYASGVDKSNPNLAAKIQIMNGSGNNVVRRGGPIRAARAGMEYSFTISGLEPQTTYDLYYVAVDTAGNYCEYSEPLIPPMEIHTLDGEAPTVTQEFTNEPTTSTEAHPTPYPDSTVNLVFSEAVIPIYNNNGTFEAEEPNFENAYQDARGGDAAKQLAFANLLKEHIKLYHKPASGAAVLVPERTAANDTSDDWVIDYRNAVISRDPDTGEMIISFPYNTAIKLGSGNDYYFVISNIADNANNRMVNRTGNREGNQLNTFTTIDAQLEFSDGSAVGTDPATGSTLNFDMNFRITPRMASNVSSDVLWDLLFWTSDDMTIDLYSRPLGGSWQKLSPEGGVSFHPARNQLVGRSLHTDFLHAGETVVDFEQMRNWGSTEREYGVIVTHRNGQPRDNSWSGSVSLDLVAVAGTLGNMRTLSNTSLVKTVHDSILANTSFVKPVGTPSEFPRTCPFRDTLPPTFSSNTPGISPLDTGATIDVALSRRNTTYRWVVIPLNRITDTQLTDGTVIRRGDETAWLALPEGGVDTPETWNTTCAASLVINPSDEFPHGEGTYNSNSTVAITINDQLTSRTKYIAYFVLEGESDNSRSGVYAFRFETKAVTRPNLTVAVPSPEGTIDSNGQKATVHYALLTAGTQNAPFTDLLSDHASGEAWDALTDAQKREYGSYNILKAMQEDAPDGSGSCFDVFVSPNSSAARTIVQLLTSPNTGGGALIRPGHITLDEGNNYLHSENYTALLNASPNTQYWLVAIGQRDGSTSWAFRAASYLRRVDTEQPKVGGFNVSITAAQEINGRMRYSGTIALRFNEPLYFRTILTDPDSKVKIIDKMGVDERLYRSTLALLPDKADGRFSIANHAVSPDTPDASAQDCYGFTIQFNNCFIGDTLMLQGALCDSDGNIGVPPLSLTLTRARNPGDDPTFEYSDSLTASVWQLR